MSGQTTLPIPPIHPQLRLPQSTIPPPYPSSLILNPAGASPLSLHQKQQQQQQRQLNLTNGSTGLNTNPNPSPNPNHQPNPNPNPHPNPSIPAQTLAALKALNTLKRSATVAGLDVEDDSGKSIGMKKIDGGRVGPAGIGSGAGSAGGAGPGPNGSTKTNGQPNVNGITRSTTDVKTVVYANPESKNRAWLIGQIESMESAFKEACILKAQIIRFQADIRDQNLTHIYPHTPRNLLDRFERQRGEWRRRRGLVAGYLAEADRLETIRVADKLAKAIQETREAEFRDREEANARAEAEAEAKAKEEEAKVVGGQAAEGGDTGHGASGGSEGVKADLTRTKLDGDVTEDDGMDVDVIIPSTVSGSGETDEQQPAPPTSATISSSETNGRPRPKPRMRVRDPALAAAAGAETGDGLGSGSVRAGDAKDESAQGGGLDGVDMGSDQNTFEQPGASSSAIPTESSGNLNPSHIVNDTNPTTLPDPNVEDGLDYMRFLDTGSNAVTPGLAASGEEAAALSAGATVEAGTGATLAIPGADHLGTGTDFETAAERQDRLAGAYPNLYATNADISTPNNQTIAVHTDIAHEVNTANAGDGDSVPTNISAFAPGTETNTNININTNVGQANPLNDTELNIDNMSSEDIMRALQDFNDGNMDMNMGMGMGMGMGLGVGVGVDGVVNGGGDPGMGMGMGMDFTGMGEEGAGITPDESTMGNQMNDGGQGQAHTQGSGSAPNGNGLLPSPAIGQTQAQTNQELLNLLAAFPPSSSGNDRMDLTGAGGLGDGFEGGNMQAMETLEQDRADARDQMMLDLGERMDVSRTHADPPMDIGTTEALPQQAQTDTLNNLNHAIRSLPLPGDGGFGSGMPVDFDISQFSDLLSGFPELAMPDGGGGGGGMMQQGQEYGTGGGGGGGGNGIAMIAGANGKGLGETMDFGNYEGYGGEGEAMSEEDLKKLLAGLPD